jgi:hypothetical protein
MVLHLNPVAADDVRMFGCGWGSWEGADTLLAETSGRLDIEEPEESWSVAFPTLALSFTLLRDRPFDGMLVFAGVRLDDLRTQPEAEILRLRLEAARRDKYVSTPESSAAALLHASVAFPEGAQPPFLYTLALQGGELPMGEATECEQLWSPGELWLIHKLGIYPDETGCKEPHED